MKNAIITLVVIFILVLVVLPLLYITLGKLRNPIDAISNDITRNTYANQNYIPDSADPSDPSQKSKPVFNSELEASCNASSTPIKALDVVDIVDAKTGAYSATSTAYRFELRLPGTWKKVPKSPAALKEQSGSIEIVGGVKPEQSLEVGLFATIGQDATCTSYFTRTFPLSHDSGRYMSEMSDGLASSGLSLREKGLVTIRGVQWYWYGYEKSPIEYPEATPKEKKYFLVYNAYRNGIDYTVTFRGNQEANGTYRSVVNAAVQDLGGLMLK